MRKARIFIVLLAAGLSIFFWAKSSLAEQWSNPFIQFELPPNWQCSRERREYVCQNRDLAKKREAVIILAAKVAGSADTLDEYEKYLKQKREFSDPFGRKVRAKSLFVKKVKRPSGDVWVDGLSQNSEVLGFQTRYLATVKKEEGKQDMAVLVTFSVRKDRYKSYLNDIQTLIKSMVLFHPNNLDLANADTEPGPGSITAPIFNRNNSLLNKTLDVKIEDRVDNQVIARQDLSSLYMLIAALILVVFYVIRKRRRR